MGAWGAGIFSNDTALDIKQEYQTLLAFGTPEEEAYELIKKEYMCESDGETDVEFWFTVATMQHKYGILLPEVRDTTLRCIDGGWDEVEWQGGDKRTLREREKVRNDLKEKLLAPPLPRKKVPKPRIQKPRWQVGDVIASQIVCPEYKDKWYYNKYVLYRVHRLERSGLSNLKPDLAYNEWVHGLLYNWIGDELPEPSLLEILDYHWYQLMNVERPVLANYGLFWIPRNERYTLFHRDPDSVMPSKDEIYAYDRSAFSVFSFLEGYSDHFKIIYNKYKNL